MAYLWYASAFGNGHYDALLRLGVHIVIHAKEGSRAMD